MLNLQYLSAKRRIKGKRGFTLMEILIVLAIIGMLVAVVGPTVMSKFEDSKRKVTALQIATLISSLENLKLDIGRDPTDEEGLQALVADPGIPGWNGPYITGGVLPTDKWNNAFFYQAPAEGQETPLILSYGADGKEGGAGKDADIASVTTAS